MKPLIAAALLVAFTSATLAGEVLTGADVLKRDNYKVLEGKRIALVTNQTGRDREGNHLAQLLFEAKNVKLVKFLAPEHGLYGTQDSKIADTKGAQAADAARQT